MSLILSATNFQSRVGSRRLNSRWSAIRQSIVPVTRPLGLSSEDTGNPCECGEKDDGEESGAKTRPSVSASAIAPARRKIDLSSADIGLTI